MLPENRINESSNPADNAEETIEVDLSEEVEVEDATGDVNVAAKLPPRNVYAVKWEAKKDNGVYAAKGKKEPHRAYVAASLIGSIQDEEFEGTPVYVNHINSLTMRGKPTSELHHFLNVCGAPAPNRSTIGELKEHTEGILEQSPVAMAELDWRASYKNNDGEYIDIAKTMTKFPKHIVDGKWDGSYEQTIPSPLDDEPVNAQLYVRQHLSQAEANKLKAKSRAA